MQCLYCGCVQLKACVVRLSEQPADIRAIVIKNYKAAGMRVPTHVGCSWFSKAPPVCSAPECMKKHAEAAA